MNTENKFLKELLLERFGPVPTHEMFVKPVVLSRFIINIQEKRKKKKPPARSL